MQALREAIYFLVDILGINRFFRSLTRDRVRVLMYHGIGTRPLPTFYWTHIGNDVFERQMTYLKSRFCVNTFNELLDGADRQSAAVITFDDGLENTFAVAWPILSRHNLRAICFVLPELSEKRQRIWADHLYSKVTASPDCEVDLSPVGLTSIPASSVGDRAERVGETIEALKSKPESHRRQAVELVEKACREDSSELRLMTPGQIKELAESDEFEVAGHTSTHPILSTLTAEEQMEQIGDCLDRLDEWGIEAPPVFAYPNGRLQDFNQESVTLLKQRGIRAAVSTVDDLWKKDDDLFSIPRVAVGADTSMLEFKAKLSGFFYFLQNARSMFSSSKPGEGGYGG